MASQRGPGSLASLRSVHATFVPSTPEERDAARQQLERILGSPVFRNSKRYAAVLRYIVERTLDGSDAQLKERTIGIEVFGREPDYDTATDHVVRSAIAEIRKRLAQYYQEDPSGGELRIEVQPGSYIPQFRWILDRTPPLVEEPAVSGDLQHQIAIVLPTGDPLKLKNRRYFLWGAALTLGTAALVAILLLVGKPEDPLDRFWHPLLASRAPVLLCIGNLEGGNKSASEPLVLGQPYTVSDFHRADSETVHVYDAITLAKFAGLLQGKGKDFHLASQSEANFADLQNGPAVLVGLMNNDWTERLISKLRFTVERTGPGKIIIRDRNNPANSDWSMDYTVPYMDVTKDYALVLRVTDPKTEQMVVVAAGISVFGTLSAGDFLTNANEMKKLGAVAPRDWEGKNLELVLSTDVIRGKPGHATIIAANFW